MKENCQIYIMGFIVLKKTSYSAPPHISFSIFYNKRTKTMNKTTKYSIFVYNNNYISYYL